MEVEDDLLFADLTRRISLLIMDDEDDDPVSHNPSVSPQFQDLSGMTVHPPVRFPLVYDNEHFYGRESKGTGVFIPAKMPPQQRRKQRHGSSFNSSSHRIKSANTSLNSQLTSASYFQPKKSGS